eukprot:3573440-Rhodomonas_salina.3
MMCSLSPPPPTRSPRSAPAPTRLREEQQDKSCRWLARHHAFAPPLPPPPPRASSCSQPRAPPPTFLLQARRPPRPPPRASPAPPPPPPPPRRRSPTTAARTGTRGSAGAHHCPLRPTCSGSRSPPPRHVRRSHTRVPTAMQRTADPAHSPRRRLPPSRARPARSRRRAPPSRRCRGCSPSHPPPPYCPSATLRHRQTAQTPPQTRPRSP